MKTFIEYCELNKLSTGSYTAQQMYNMYYQGECSLANSQAFSVPCQPVPAVTKMFNVKTKVKTKLDCTKEKEVENTMTTVNTERTYLVNRVREVNYSHRDTLETNFKPYDSATPKTYKDLIDAIKNGAYTLDAKKTKKIDLQVEDDGRYYGSAFDGIIWNGGPDLKGYYAAQETLAKAYQDTMDIVQTSDAATGLKALKDFEAWVAPTPATTTPAATTAAA